MDAKELNVPRPTAVGGSVFFIPTVMEYRNDNYRPALSYVQNDPLSSAIHHIEI